MATGGCLACSAKIPPAEPRLFEIPAITSDCRPWSAGRSVAMCPCCGLMQRVVLPDAAPAFAKVYDQYEMFKHAANAADQINFSVDGAAEGRTQKILKFITGKLLDTPRSVLDVGSGSGAGLLALAQQFPQASIYGFEPNDRPAERQKNLPQNVISIFHKRPETPDTYDLITLFHVFEHIDDLGGMLDFIRKALTAGGHLLIQVPYVARGAFDLVIADHIWHFTKKSLVALLQKAGFTAVYIGNDVIEKELTLLAVPGVAIEYTLPIADEIQQGHEAIDWLVHYAAFLEQVRKEHLAVAVYGTGPAAAWAGHVLGQGVQAYLDDDPARQHATFNDKPILSPNEMDATVPVVAPFPDYQARWIAQKNQALHFIDFKILRNS